MTSWLVVQDVFVKYPQIILLLLLLVAGECLFRKSHFFSSYTLIIEIVLIKAKSRQRHVPVTWEYVLRFSFILCSNFMHSLLVSFRPMAYI